MPIQEQVAVLVTYAAESTWGTAPAAGGPSQRLRRVSSNLNLAKDTFASNEVRADQQIAVYRHGGHRVAGAIQVELSTVTCDDFLEALMRGTWTAGVSKSQVQFASAVSDNAASSFTFGGGDALTEGFKIGDVIRFTTLAATANNNVNFRITNISGASNRTLTVTPAPATDAVADTSFTVAVVGRKLAMGTTKRSFAIEHSYPDIDIAELFVGCRVSGCSLQVPPNGIATASFEFMGRDASVLSAANAPYFTAATAAGASDVLTGIGGSVRLGGVEQAILTGMDLQIAGNMSSAPVIGSVLVPNIFPGRLVVTGNVSFFLQDEVLLNLFVNETAADLVVQMQASGAAPQQFIVLNMQNVKLGAAQKQPGVDNGVLVQAPFQALLKVGGAATAYDQSTLVIQRSNA